MEILTEEEDQFFDTREDITSVSDSGSDCPENLDSDFGVIGSLPGSIGYEVWIKNPGCIHERRNKFLKWMGLDVDQTGRDDPGNTSSNEVEVETDRIVEHRGAVLRSYSFDYGFSSSQSSMSCWSNDSQELLDGALEEDFVCRIRNLDNGAEFVLDEIWLDGLSERIREVGSNRLLTVAEFEMSLGFSHLVQQVMRREVEDVPNLGLARKQVKMGWLRRLGAVACIVDRQVEAGGIKSNGPYPVARDRNQIVRVKSYKKWSKEFSALYMRQDIPDGQYLASFLIMGCNQCLHETRYSIMIMGCNQCLQVFFHNDYVTCVQFNPVDENYFISGSIDGKVRIWTIPGCQVVDWTDITEIVTAVCYCPDGKGGIVGSMTGNCHFYDAPDNRLRQYAQICMQGKKKSPFKRITGFQFSPSDPTRLMVTSADSQVRILHGVDVICKYRGLRNAGSQISASFTSDGMRIVSASEDSNVYIWNYISQDGPVAQVKSKWCCDHFFSNNVSIAIPWCGMMSGNSISPNVTGKSPSSINLGHCSEKSVLLQSDELVEISQCKLPFSSPDNFSLSYRLFSHSLPKGSATWPEENLPASSLVVSSAMCKSQYKFMKMSCQSMHGSPHAWGLVIVTAGWDRRIRSFQNYGLPVRL